MKNSWIRCGIATALSFVASVALGNAFSGPNPDTQNLTWNGFSNGSVGVSVSTNSGANFTGGSFRAQPSAVRDRAQFFLTSITNGSTAAPGWTLFEFTSDSKQNYLSVEHSGPLQSTPEPGTLILLGVGALAAWGTSKHHR